MTTRLLNDDLSEKGRQSVTVRVAADGHTKAFVLKKPKNLSKLYFLKLTLEDKAGKLVSDNFYWLSTSPEIPGEMNEARDSFSLEPRSVPDYTALNALPPVKVTVSNQFAREGGETVANVTVKNPSNKLAFAAHLAVTQGKGGNEIGPTYWQDNYFSLLPGEERTVQGRIATKHLEVPNRFWSWMDGTCRSSRSSSDCRDGSQVVTTQKPPQAVEKSACDGRRCAPSRSWPRQSMMYSTVGRRSSLTPATEESP